MRSQLQRDPGYDSKGTERGNPKSSSRFKRQYSVELPVSL